MKINLEELRQSMNQSKSDPKAGMTVQEINSYWLNYKFENSNNPEGVSFEDAIRMTSAKFTCWCLEFDEIYNELVIFFLKAVKNCSSNDTMESGWENFINGFDRPLAFCFKIIKNRAIDIYRRARKNWDEKAELIDDMYTVQDSVSTISPIADEDEMYQNVLQRQFRDSYPVMSRPWIYITLKLAAAGMIPESELKEHGLYLPESDGKIRPGVRVNIRDIDIIPQMGFKGTKPSSYYAIKFEIREDLSRFLEDRDLFDL